MNEREEKKKVNENQKSEIRVDVDLLLDLLLDLSLDLSWVAGFVGVWERKSKRLVR